MDDGAVILVEASEVSASPTVVPGQRVPIGAQDVAERAAKSVEEAVARLQPALIRVADELRKTSPEQIEISFGLKFSIGAFWFVTARSDANFDVKLVWKAASKSE